jgi:DNA-binding PucR family transcriptional regulator
MVPTDEREARLRFSLASATARRAVDPDRVCRAFESAGVRARLAFGRLEDGLTGFRTSLKQAERVKEVAVAGGDQQSARVVFYGEVAPIALMASDLDQLRRFVSDVLSDLGVDDERCRWLRETLREFLARIRSHVATAEAMILHRNTIQYRVVQAMELCGQSFDDPDAVFKVQTALEACRWMDPSCRAHKKRPELHRRRVWRRSGFGGYCYARPTPNPQPKETRWTPPVCPTSAPPARSLGTG